MVFQEWSEQEMSSTLKPAWPSPLLCQGRLKGEDDGSHHRPTLLLFGPGSFPKKHVLGAWFPG